MRFFSLALGVCLLGVTSFLLAQKPPELLTVDLSGVVVDEQNLPVPDIWVRSIVYDQTTETRTDAEGNFSIEAKGGKLRDVAIVADDVDGNRMGLYFANIDKLAASEEEMPLQLAPCRKLPVEVKDAEGNPSPTTIVGALVRNAVVTTGITDRNGKATLRWPEQQIPTHLFAFRPRVGFDYRAVDPSDRADWLDHPPVTFQLAPSQPIELRVVDRESRPLPGVTLYPWLLQKPGEPNDFNLGFTPTYFPEKTDQDGVATFQGLPQWNVRPLTFFPHLDNYGDDRVSFDFREHPDGQMTITLDRLVPVSGQVVFADGRPVAGVTVAAQGEAYDRQRESQRVKTDAAGKFDLKLPPDFLFSFAVESKKWGSPLLDGILTQKDTPIENLKLTAAPATRVFGHVYAEPSGTPVAGKRLTLTRVARALQALPGVTLPNPTGNREIIAPWHTSIAETDQDGMFEFFVGPGEFILEGPLPDDSHRFYLATGKAQQFNLFVPDQQKKILTGQVVTGDPPQLAGKVVVEGRYAAQVGVIDMRIEVDDQGNFSGNRFQQPLILYAHSSDGKLAGMFEVGPQENKVSLAIAPVASAKGRLIDSKTKVPLRNTAVKWSRPIQLNDRINSTTYAWEKQTKTNDEGRFEISAMVVGQTYQIFVLQEKLWRRLDTFTPLEAKREDLGDIPIPIAP